MKLSLPPDRLAAYLGRQIESIFPEGPISQVDLGKAVEHALERVRHCFSRIRQRYYRADGEAVFDHLNTDQYAAFLYLVGNSIHRHEGDPRLAAKTYGLNKAMHGLDVYFEVTLPDVFAFVHPVGTVIGRGTFNDYFCIYQNCTIGGDLEGNLPTVGRGVVLFAGSRAIGKSRIGNNCMLAAGTIVNGAEVPNDCLAFGISPNLTFKSSRRDVVRDIFQAEGEVVG